ncbi:MAG: C40 family peptidase [Candidatus Terrybacteria bacterium]|nr:C40 family peptidase [Candidatus Terrybacteria bacterium]
MKISYNWLQLYFKKKLPMPEKVAEILEMHSFEVEGIEKKGKDFVFDISVLPNRAHDCLSHLGIAKEIGVITGLKIRNPKSEIRNKFKIKNSKLKIEIQEPELCKRYIGRIIEGVKVGPSPKWLKEKLEAIGQKTINNIVDAANFAMFEIGQPLHAFDLDKIEGAKIKNQNAKCKIIVRKAKKGEKITTLDNQEIDLDENILVIADKKSSLAIAGIKGGKKAEIDKNTRNIILEAANFEQTNIRLMSRKIGLRTDSSLRFENEITPELAEGAMERVTEIILQSAKGKAGANIDFYPKKPNSYKIGLHPKDVSKLLGIEISEKGVVDILSRLGFKIKEINPIKNVLKLAKSLIGKPYKYGASVTFDAPESFDCSSFVSYVFAHSGIQIPRMSIDQYFFGKPVDMKDIKPGDVIFSNSKNGKIHYESKDFMKGLKVKDGVDHCGIYLGSGKIIHATRKKGKIMIEDLKKSEQFKHIVGVRRMSGEKDDLLLVEVPPERLDVRIKEDLIEEAARIYDYEKIPAKLPEETIIPPRRNDNVFYAEMIRNILAGDGFSEVYNYSFGEKGDIELANPLAKDKKFLRTNLMDGLNANIRNNTPHFKNIKIFEIGKIFYNDVETASLAGAISSVDFFAVKGVIETLLEKLGISDYYFADAKDKVADIRVGNTSIGVIDHNAFEINFEMLVKLAEEEAEYRPISKFPAVKRDIALFVPFEVKIDEVQDVIENTAGELLADTDLFDIFENSERKSLAFHLIFQSRNKTLEEKEINRLMDKIFKALEANPEWEVRK